MTNKKALRSLVVILNQTLLRAVFLKAWLRATEEKRRFPSGMTTKIRDSASEEKAVRAIPSGSRSIPSGKPLYTLREIDLAGIGEVGDERLDEGG
jgi:hypothetical protein